MSKQPAASAVAPAYRGGFCLAFNEWQCHGMQPANIDMSVLFAGVPICFLSVQRKLVGLLLHSTIFFTKACMPMRLENMRPWLERYPDRERAQLLPSGVLNCFPLPAFWGEGCVVVENLKSVHQFLQMVYEKIAKEIAEGRVAGPFLVPPFSNFHISPFGVVPKKEPNSFRLIHHLSFHGVDGSMNNEIDGSLCSVTYATFEEVVVKIRAFGPGALLAIADIKSAFRLLPVSPLAFNSLGFYSDGSFYFDKSLPMGCSLPQTYFEMFSTFLHWVVGSESRRRFC